MVEQVLTNDGGARAVEVDRSDIAGIVGDEEVAIDRRQHAEQHGAGDIEGIGQRQHGHHHSALTVDEHRHGKEGEADGPRILADNILEACLQLGHIVGEIGVGQPGNAIDGYHSHHTRLPHRTCHCLLGTGLGKEYHEGGCRNHDYLDDDVHADGLHDGRAVVGHLAAIERRTDVETNDLHERVEHDDCEGAYKDIDRQLGRRADLLVEHGGGAAIHILAHLGIGQTGLELRVFVEVLTALIRKGSSCHQSAQTGGNGDGDDLQVVDLEASIITDDDKRRHGSGNGRTRDTYLRGHRRHATGALRTDAFLQGDVADDRHQRIDHMARAHQHREEEGAEGCQERDMGGMFSQ